MGSEADPVPGTADLWEPEVGEWLALESAARDVFALYGYGELRTPIFERRDVFVRSIGDETDVVQKEMYTFEDRGGRSLALRPEGTAGVMRAIAKRGLAQGEERRVFYMGPMFRGERPAAGRRRQFHQIGVEAVGRCVPAMDVECIAMMMHYLEAIGINDGRLLLNTRGLADDRENVSLALRSHFEPVAARLCGDCQRRLHSNVWRVLDCKNAQCQDAIEAAPLMTDLLGDEGRSFFANVCAGLDALGLSYEIVPRLVRGLDYYVHTVFEVVHAGLGAQDALAGGGRYQISLPGSDKQIEGVGFAAGMERLFLARDSLGFTNAEPDGPDVYIVSLGSGTVLPGVALAQRLRREGYRAIAEVAERSMKAQMRAAHRVRAKLVLIQGEAELASGTVACKDMSTSSQEDVQSELLTDWIADRLGSSGKRNCLG